LRARYGARWVAGVWFGAVPGWVLAQAPVAPAQPAQRAEQAAPRKSVTSPRQARPVPAAPRVSTALDHGWRFKQSGELTGVENRAFDDSGWSTVDIPHTWNRVGNEGVERSPQTNVVRGVGWYRLRFETPPAAGGAGPERYFLQFDGVGAIADVWLNGHYLGKHAGAFARFRFDATEAIDRSGENLLVVKADNSRPQPGATTEAVIPLSGDFFVFGGIYRKVSLVVTDPVHVDMLDYGGPGVYAHATAIEPGAATVQVSTRLVNDAARPAAVRVEASIEDTAGKAVARATKEATLAPRALTGDGAGSNGAAGDGTTTNSPRATTLVLDLRVQQPHLWRGTKDPYLYRTVLTVRSPTGAILDRVTQPLGLRTIAFDPDKGFFLNGEHVALHGVSMHQDRPVKGWAISDQDQEQDFHILADLGGNAVRLAHYQHDQRSYELADELGIIAWAEIPLVNQVSFDGSPASAALAANATQQLHELIKQNYNHPAIALWSIANEVDLLATLANGPSKARALLESLDHLAKTEDPGRFTTFADCCEPGLTHNTSTADARRDTIVGSADTIGYNRYFGWYGGAFADLGPMLDAAHARHPKLPIALSEYGAGAALTQHSDDPAGEPVNPKGRPHPEEYQDIYHEAAWETLRQRPWLWGVFVWNLFDFASDSRQEGDLTDMNDKGLVSYDRATMKDAFYFYRANWSPRPTLHLVGRRYVDRTRGVLDVKAYSNATRAELWLNGVSKGTSPCSGGICLWRSVHLQPGANEVRAAADIGGTRVTDNLQWKLAGR
jgi:beta-galactosidase